MDGCQTYLAPRRAWWAPLLIVLFGGGVRVDAAEPKAPVRIASLAFIEPDGTRQAVVEVLSDGEVHAIELRGSRSHRTETVRVDYLTREELRALYNELVVQTDIVTLSTESVRESIQAASESQQLGAEIEEAADTEIGLRIGTRWHTVQCPAAALLAVRFPDSAEVATVATVQARLQNIAAVALVGGSETADRYATNATRKLHEMHPDARELTRRDLAMVRRLADGSAFVQFRYRGSPHGQDACLVSLTQSTSGPPRVSILDTPTVIR